MTILTFKKKYWLTVLVLLLAVTLLGDMAAIACTRVPKNYLVVAPAGGDFHRLSDALKSITDASASNRYTIVVQGRIVEDGNKRGVDGYIDAKSHVDVIGQGATIEMWVPEATERDYGVQFLDVADSEWRDLNIVIKEMWDQMDFPYTGDNSSPLFGSKTIGCSFPIKVRGKTDRTARLVNIKTSWDWQAGTKAWSYGGAIMDLASPTIIDSEFREGPWEHSYGFNICGIGSSLLINSRFIGGGGSGGKDSAANYGLVIESGTPTIIGGVAEGGLGNIESHAVYISGGEPTLVGFVGKPQEFSYAFTYDTANPPVNGQFRPDVGADFRYLIRSLYLTLAEQPRAPESWTINIGVSPGGSEVASVSGSANSTYTNDVLRYIHNTPITVPIERYVSNAGDYLYISTSNITGKIYVKYTVMPAIGEEGYITASLYLGKTSAKITGSTFYGTWAWNPPLGLSPEAGVNPEWEITSSSFIQLWEGGIDSTAYSAMNWFGGFFEMPAYYCTFQGDFYNVRPIGIPFNSKGQ